MDTLENIIMRQRTFFLSGRTLPVSFRIEQLRLLQRELLNRHPELEAAVKGDLQRHPFETFLAETLLVLGALQNAIRHTPHWAAPKKTRSSIVNFYSRDTVTPEPYGVSLIISPWNYPMLLSLGPLIAAISAGNCAIIKPSELAPAASALLADVIASVFPAEYITVIQGDADTARALLEHEFDKIFFTGGARVGAQVLQAAARHITPVTLELGGKSPCIVTDSADLPVASRRIIWGKMLNAGQTCVAPDYVLVHRSKKEALIARLIESITAFYGSDIRQNPEYPRIINAQHHARLVSYLEPEKIVWGGEHNREELYLGPTIMAGVTWEDRVMKEEIFGPILPVIVYDSLEEAIGRINAREKPLALYLFTADRRQTEAVWSRCRFGGGCVNDTLSHLVNDRLPFGGVGASGMGSYHGRWGFDTFSHYKSRLYRALRPEIFLRYPPHSNKERLKSILLTVFGR